MADRRNDIRLANTRRNARDFRRDQSPYFSPDSGARQVQHEETFAPQPQPKRYVKRRRRYQKEFVSDIQENLAQHFLSYVVVIAFFGGILTVLLFSAQLSQAVAQREAASLNLANLTSSNIARRGEMESGIDAAALEHYAIHNLGMVRPEEFQRVEISVARPATSDTPYASDSNSFSISAILNSLFSVTVEY